MNLLQILHYLPESSMNDWDDLIKGLDITAIQTLDRNASYWAIVYAMFSEYLAYRGSAGFGDHGHYDALKQARKMEKRIRKALGYTYP
jgi:hypothetical protein